MESESLNDPNSPDGHESLENGTPKLQTNGGEGDAELKAHGKSPRASEKRLIQRAPAETEILPVTQPYLISPRSMSGDYQGRPDESFGSDVRATLLLLREKIWLIIFCILLPEIAGVTYIILRPPIYRAQAVVRVDQGAQKVLKAEENGIVDLNRDEIIKTTEQSLTSPELLLQLMKRNDLNKDPAFLPGLKRPASDSRVVEELTKKISVQVRRGTWLIDIGVLDQSPLMAQKIADLLIKEFAYENFRRHIEGSEMAVNFLLEESKRLKANLAKSEEALQAYKEEHQAGALGEKENTVSERLRALSRLVAEAQATRLKLEADYDQIKKLGTNPPAGLLAIPAVASSSPVIALEKAVSEKEAEVAALTEMYKHPIHTGAVKQLQQLKASLDRTILQAAREVTNAYDSAAANEKKMDEALQEQDRAALQLSKMSISYDMLREEVESDRALYESVLNRSKETDATKNAVQDTIAVVSHPLLPDRPVSPHKGQILLICFFGGLTLGCGLALLSRALDHSFRTPDEAERRLGVPALGVIPKCARPKWLTDDLLLLERPGSGTAESFRNLRTSLSLLGKNSGHKTFLFTSAGILEGKSFCAINCAAAFAQQGLKTLLIDADLRSPSMDGIFFDGAPVQGLTDILTNQTDLDCAVRQTNINKLFVLCAGCQLDSPTELLAGERFGQLIRETTAKFDRVVVDSAPVHAVSDTLLLVGHVQATCLVVSTRTSAETVFQAARKLCNAGSTLVGFIFNRVSRHHGGDHLYQPYQLAGTRADAGSG
ncbi:MAG: polysaccharide biosynthesis tyrosine autokinase [Verrucomicrobia bacterium]|nr:polysaccharide biosynthesis tyrosine autokinase [Verrucomicrobiota bacterium]